MKKILLLMIAGLLFVSFAGYAFAQPAVGVFSENGFKASNPVNLKPGEIVTLDVIYDDMAVNSNGIALAEGKQMYYYKGTTSNNNILGELEFYADPMTADAEADDLKVTIHGGYVPVSPVNYGVLAGIESPYFIDLDAVTLELASDASQGARYEVLFGSKFGTETEVVETGVFANQVSSIPEFPAIAAPIASIIGLLFLFGRKKEGL